MIRESRTYFFAFDQIRRSLSKSVDPVQPTTAVQNTSTGANIRSTLRWSIRPPVPRPTPVRPALTSAEAETDIDGEVEEDDDEVEGGDGNGEESRFAEDAGSLKTVSAFSRVSKLPLRWTEGAW